MKARKVVARSHLHTLGGHFANEARINQPQSAGI
jgi:hypothetical protein